jgi:hypothetical protein
MDEPTASCTPVTVRFNFHPSKQLNEMLSRIDLRCWHHHQHHRPYPHHQAFTQWAFGQLTSGASDCGRPALITVSHDPSVAAFHTKVAFFFFSIGCCCRIQQID